MTRLRHLPALLLVSSILAAAPAVVRPERMDDAATIRLGLERLGVLGSALYVAAHPDDENTAMISWLASGRLVRTGYLAVTRGDGGQNLIGNEKGELLGVIRTLELLEARRIDGGEQFFTRAIDFGYSKTPEETLRIWGKERILGDFVRVIRMFRPDVIVTRFPPDGSGGHGHHTASAILAEEAFRLAADPGAYPEQVGRYGTWQARRIFWNSWRPAETTGLVAVDLGEFNPMLGRSYTELAGESRSMHKSQGFGAAERRGSLLNYLELRGGAPAADDPFEGIDLSWRRVRGGETIPPILERARAAFHAEDPSAIVPHLIEMRHAIQALPAHGRWEIETVERKLQELDELIRQAAGIWIEAVAPVPAGVPGTSVATRLTVVNRSRLPLLAWTAAPQGGAIRSEPIAYNQPWAPTIEIAIPEGAPFTHPFWLRQAHDDGAWRIVDSSLIGLAVEPEPLRLPLVLEIDGEPVGFEIPVTYRWTDPVLGERYRTFEIHPPATANVESGVLLFPEAEEKVVRVLIKAGPQAVRGIVRPVIPEGWGVRPASIGFELGEAGAEQVVAFTLTPPEEAAEGDLSILIDPEGWSTPYFLSRLPLDYPHIPVQTLLPHATASLIRADVRRRGERIGYVMGAGDEVPEALRQMGYEVALLTDEEIGSGDLGSYDAIVIGVRAYNTRKRLGALQRRLFDWVERGGTLVTQYSTLDRDLPETIGPYPLKISRDRVTVEESPVEILSPRHPVASAPNRITEADFERWVQERGLYFPNEWSSEYEPVLAMFEPGEDEKRGSILVARHGRGVFIHTSIAFFRQLPAGVPGAYRLFANLVSARNGEPDADD
ncbi:MAG TPA: PIG-L family deacetylase [Thermoanaerobaculia bacterium]|nr:PIG-L family deacetylase [Thermoanaerobaculia bacterium]